MIDRQQLEAVLQKRFPNATLEQIGAAANAIIALETSMRSGDCQVCGSRRASFHDRAPAAAPARGEIGSGAYGVTAIL